MKKSNFFALVPAILSIVLSTGLKAQDLQNELAQLDVELATLANRLKRPLPKVPKPVKVPPPAPTPPEVQPIKEAEYIEWPKGTKVEIAKDNFIDAKGKEFNTWIATKNNMIPVGTRIMAPGWQQVKLTIGQKSYYLWKRSGFYILEPGPGVLLTPGLQYIKISDIEDFPAGTEIVIRQTKKEKKEPAPEDIKLVKDDKDLDFYLDETERLLAVISAKAGDEELKFVSIGSYPLYKTTITQFIES